MMHSIRTRWLIAALVVVSFAGCSRMNKPNAQFIEGTVRFQEKPLANATVSFLPKMSGTEALFASGKTDADGKFTLTIRPNGDPGRGTTPGDYLVLVTCKKDKPSRVEKTDTGEIPYYDSLIPQKYGSKLHSDLSAFVEKKEKNEFVFELKDK